MTTLERLLNGEFIHPSTWFGVNLLRAGVPRVGVGGAPFAAYRAGTAGREFPGPHVGRILASHGGSTHLGAGCDSLCECDS